MMSESRACAPALLEQAVRHSSALIFAFDASGVLTVSEGKALEHLGLKPGEAVGRSVFDLYAGEPELLASVRRALTGETFSSIERLKTRALIWEIHWAPIMAPDGHQIGVSGIANEIRPRQLHEDALKELARGASVPGDGHVLDTLARSLARACRTSGAFVSELVGDGQRQLRMIGLYPDGPAGSSALFEVAGSPCEVVLREGFCAYPEGANRRFPHHPVLADLGVEAYMGIALKDANGSPIGVLGIIHTERLEHVDIVETLLKIAASRAEAELARWRSDSLLSKARQRLEHILRVSPSVSYVLCVHADCTLWLAEGITSLLGYTVEEAKEKCWWERHLHPEDRELALATGRLLPEQGHLVQVYRFRHRNGSYRWIRDELRLVDAGGCAEIVGALTDITEQRQAEEALRDSEERYRLLADNSTDLIGVYVPFGELRYVSPACRQILGYEPEELIGWSAIGLVHPDDLPRVACSRSLLDDGASSVKGEYRMRRKSGEYVWLEVVTRAVRNSGTGIVQMHMASGRDITDRKRADEALAALNRQKELILQSAGEGIYGIDREGRVTFINPAGARMLGYEPEELIGVCVATQAARPIGSPFPAHASLTFPMSTHGQPLCARDEVFWRRDGSGFLAEYTSMPLHEGDETIGAVVTFNDVSVRRKAEAELRAAYAELQNLSRLKDGFLSTVSHELRTPMAAIKSAVSILAKQRAGMLTESQARFVGIIGAHVTRLNRLVDDVLDLQKMEAGRLNFNLERRDLRPVLEEAAGSMAHFFEGQGITFTLSVQEGAPPVHFDRDYMIQLLLNLLSNAAKFTPRGGHVVLRAGYRNEEWIVEVEDTGCGIAADKLPHIFDKFYQVDGGLTRQAAGTGLGLAICKHIVEGGHSGRIWVTSVSEVGSTFSFTLPAGHE